MALPMTASVESAARRKLPIGIQTFREIREDGCYYVDKTDFIRRLVEGGKHYFLSRPRRFGKSLLLDTIKELFEGSEALFRGLAIHDKWEWGRPHPVLRLDFGSGDLANPDFLKQQTAAQLEAIETRAGAPAGGGSARIRFRRLIAELHERSGRRWWFWWTNTTSRSLMRWAPWTSPAPTAASCTACTPSSRPATRTSIAPC